MSSLQHWPWPLPVACGHAAGPPSGFGPVRARHSGPGEPRPRRAEVPRTRSPQRLSNPGPSRAGGPAGRPRPRRGTGTQGPGPSAFPRDDELHPGQGPRRATEDWPTCHHNPGDPPPPLGAACGQVTPPPHPAAWFRARIRCLGVRGQGAVLRSASDHQGTRGQGTESRPSSPRAPSGAYLGSGPRGRQDTHGTRVPTPLQALSAPGAQNTQPWQHLAVRAQSKAGRTSLLPPRGRGHTG